MFRGDLTTMTDWEGAPGNLLGMNKIFCNFIVVVVTWVYSFAKVDQNIYLIVSILLAMKCVSMKLIKNKTKASSGKLFKV